MPISSRQPITTPFTNPQSKAVRFGSAQQQPVLRSESPTIDSSANESPDRFQSTTPSLEQVPLTRSASLQSLQSEVTHPELQESPQPEQQKQWSYLQKSLGAVKGAFKQAHHDFFAKLKQNLLISCVITAATCWLPGSQLFTIPLWFCVDSAMSMMRGASRGWNNPDKYSHVEEEPPTNNTIPVPVGTV